MDKFNNNSTYTAEKGSQIGKCKKLKIYLLRNKKMEK